MFLKSLTLRQFRNYSSLDQTLSPHVNLFLGPNGSGKSNLLEAVCVLATGQSHRGAEAKVFAQWETGEFLLKGEFDGEEALSAEVRQKKGRPRQAVLNGRPQRRFRDWLGRVPAVSFSPDDLAAVKGEPAFRRRALNAVLCQVDPAHADALQRYNKIVQERNAALRRLQEGERDGALLEPWDAALLKEGLFLSAARRDFIQGFSPEVQAHHARLSSGRETVTLLYRPSLLLPPAGPGDMEENRRRLLALREGEIALGATLAGPHRDDMELLVDGVLARNGASQGQQRTLALAMKLAEFDLLARTLNRRPLCLLDDMFSELDPVRRGNVAESLASGGQCLVSLTALADWPEGRRYFSGNGSRIFQVREGRLSAEEAA